MCEDRGVETIPAPDRGGRGPRPKDAAGYGL